MQASAGGPAFVAGSSFDPARTGKPILWANGIVSYYTDLGNLSSLLPQDSANAFVADAFSRWTSVTTVALAATRAGALAEDVNGTNVVASQTGIALPSDIQPSSTKPLAIVYDFNGQVTDTLLGLGASDPSLCASNSVIGGVDRFSSDAHIVHALIIINGRCAQNLNDLAPLKYRLVRALGRVLGLGWSQANDNVQTGTPIPTNSDFAGFPLMHPVEPFCAGAITTCIPNADQLRMDDRAAISRLYPVTEQNINSYPGKQVFSSSRVRIRGTIYFPDVHGNPGQGMQGVNVVARIIDPDTGLPSRVAVATSVSGFLFRGNAGNAVSGFGSAQRFDAFGGADAGLEGFFDLAGLEIPTGHSTATFQITLEAVNPLYRDEVVVGPYASGMVTPSGSRPTLVLANLAAGTDVAQDILMTDAMPSKSDDQRTFIQRPVPLSGDWWGSLSGYGRTEFYRMSAKADRTINLRLTSLNETLRPTVNKSQPELGLWVGTDPAHTLPQARADAFNGTSTGVTALTAPVGAEGPVQLGIADYRGDGRPDFLYHAHLLYADTVSPSRIESAGATMKISGIGFQKGMSVAVGGTTATILGMEENSIYVQSPTLADGAKNIVVQDPVSAASATMTNAVSFGILNDDQLILVSTANPSIAVGMTAPNPVRFRIIAGDGVSPVPGATITLSISPNTSRLTACGSSSCSLTSDANGEVSTYVTVNASGANLLTASTSNGLQLSTTLVGNASLALSAANPVTRLLTGSSTTLALTSRLLSAGAGVSAHPVTYTITSGTGSLSSSSATTDGTGSASVNLTLANLTSAVSINGCSTGVACAQFSVLPVPPSNVLLQRVGGDGQMVPIGQSFQAIMLRVTDNANPPDPLANVPVSISGAIFTPTRPDCSLETGICRPVMNRPLSSFSALLNSDANGIVSYTPLVQTAWGAVQVGIITSAGVSTRSFDLRVFAPAP